MKRPPLPASSASNSVPAIARATELERIARQPGALRETSRTALIGAQDDGQAVSTWLDQECKHHSHHTKRLYRREIGRCVRWLASERNCSLSGANVDDYTAYFEYLATRPKKGSTSVLNKSSLALAHRVVSACLSYLVDVQYLQANAAKRVALPPPDSDPDPVNRALPKIAVSAIVEVLQRPWEGDQHHRSRLRATAMMALLNGLALRREEAANTMERDFIFESPLYRWRGVRKGGKTGRLEVPHAVMKAIIDYRLAMDLPALPDPDGVTPILLKLDGGSGITTKHIGEITKQLCSRAAVHLEATASPADPEAREAIHRLRSATAHWLRHTRLTNLLYAGANLAQVAELAGHKDPSITAKVYLHALTSQRETPGFNDVLI